MIWRRVFILGLLLMICCAAAGAAGQDIAPIDPAVLDEVGAWMDTLPEWDGTYRRIRVPILMYHYVSALPETADDTRITLSVTPDMFRAHMQYLFDGGYTTISLYQLINALRTGAQLPAKPVVLTFDDGYIDHYQTVYPILREFGFTGTVFVITSAPDNSAPGYVSWPQIAEMSEGGMSMENHTRDHIDLRNQDYDTLVYQLLGAQESLLAYTGRTPHFLAYPMGFYDDYTIEIARTMPLWGAVTTQFGALHTTDGTLEMPRVRISNDTSVDALAALLLTDS